MLAATTRLIALATITTVCAPEVNSAERRTISEKALRDKVQGYWVGQLVGNYIGFPFENLYDEQPIPVLIDRYYDFRDAESSGLKMNLDDRRAYTGILADALGGAWSDDDTDIELVTLHAVEQHGLDLDYQQITQFWKRHVNRFIWSAAREARDLMEQGMLPPQTGSKEHNRYWYRITSQLMTEIWGVFYPGMTDRAAQRAEWNARMMTDDWATHPDIVYAAMFSAAFFESDVDRLVQIGKSKLPPDSPYRRGIEQVIGWHRQNQDWRVTRQHIHDHYYERVAGFEPDWPVGGAVVNGLSGIMAILYGEGDFVKTVAIATTAGYDCDNQAATCGGLIGIIHGGAAIPDHLTMELPSRGRWELPFNDQYINYSRDGLPNLYRITDLVDRIATVAERAIVEGGGTRRTDGGQVRLEVITDFD